MIDTRGFHVADPLKDGGAGTIRAGCPGDGKRIAEAAGNPASVLAVRHLVPMRHPIRGGRR